jgi:hypothetical protein
MRLQPIVTACLLAGMTLLFYGFHLGAAPRTADEAAFAQQARSVTLGSAPLFFHVKDDQWLQPLGVYAQRAVQAVGGDDLSGRIVSVIAGAIDIALIFLIAQLITMRSWIGVAGAVLLMLTPAHRVLATTGTDSILPAPLVLLWLWNVLAFLRGDTIRALAMAAAWLGLSLYSHPAAPLIAGLLWLLTLIVARRRNPARLAFATVIFTAAWAPAILWFARHFDTYADTYGRWVIFAAHLRNPADGARAFVNSNTLGNRASAYWGFWDPSWLFFSTREAAAPFLLITAPFVALGIHRFLRPAGRHTAALIAGSAVLVALPGATFPAPHYISYAAAVLPLLALTAALGLDHLFNLIRPPAPIPEP